MEKEKEKDNDTPKTTVSFYGKKTYYLNPMIARKIAVKENVPDYQDNDGQKITALIPSPTKRNEPNYKG